MNLKRPGRRRCSVAAICTIAAIGIAGCGGSSKPTASTPATAPAGGSAGTASATLTTAWPTDITSLDPANLSTGQDHDLSRNIYQTLALPKFTKQKDGTLKFDGAHVQPYLAKSWTLGKSSITFHLRKGVKFYGTNDVMTASDVKFSLGRIFDTPGGGDLQSNGFQSAKDIHVIDPQTVRIDFKSADGKPTPPTPTLQVIFSAHFTGIVDEKVVKKHATAADPTGAKWLRLNTAGSGPYYLASRSPGISLTLKANPDSWMPAPAYSDVDIRITSGSISSLLQNHEVDFGEYGMTNQQVDNLAKAGLDVVWANTGNFDMFAITSGPANQVGKLGDGHVRQAIAYALPYDQVLKNIVFGRGQRSGSIVSPSAPEYTPAWSKYTTDLTKAKSLMAQAGNPTIKTPLHYLQGNEDQTNTAILIQANLKQIGIDTTLTPETQAGLFDVLNERSSPESGKKIGPPGLELFNWSAFTDDPKVVIGYWATKGGINNYSLYSDAAVNAIHKKFAALPTSSARTAAYKKAQEQIAADVPYVPIVDTGTVAVVKPGIEGVSFSPGGSGRYWTMHPAGGSTAITDAFTG